MNTNAVSTAPLPLPAFTDRAVGRRQTPRGLTSKSICLIPDSYFMIQRTDDGLDDDPERREDPEQGSFFYPPPFSSPFREGGGNEKEGVCEVDTGSA